MVPVLQDSYDVTMTKKCHLILGFDCTSLLCMVIPVSMPMLISVDVHGNRVVDGAHYVQTDSKDATVELAG